MAVQLALGRCGEAYSFCFCLVNFRLVSMVAAWTTSSALSPALVRLSREVSAKANLQVVMAMPIVKTKLDDFELFGRSIGCSRKTMFGVVLSGIIG